MHGRGPGGRDRVQGTALTTWTEALKLSAADVLSERYKTPDVARELLRRAAASPNTVP